jgi:hypothetical protein
MAEIIRRFTAYVGSDDPLMASSNAIALIVAFNQPFYPFYIRGLVGVTTGRRWRLSSPLHSFSPSRPWAGGPPSSAARCCRLLAF